MESVTPSSGTPYNLKFHIKNIGHVPIIELDYYKDINTPINGGKLTTPLDSKLYKKLRVNQTFELWWGWNNKPVKVMTGYLSHIQLEKNSIEIEFVDKGALLRKYDKLKYQKRHRLRIIAEIIQRSGLKYGIDWNGIEEDTIDYDGGSSDIQGKSYESMLQELLDKSTQDLTSIIQDQTCKIINLTRIPFNNNLPIHEGVNIIKDSVSVSEISTNLINHMTIYYLDDTRKHRVTCGDKGSIERFGMKHESVEETWISKTAHAQNYIVKLLRKNIRENGFQINLSIIASPYFELLTTCHVRLPRYGINHNLNISSLNFKASVGKTPTMDLCLHDYKHANISKA